MSDEIDPLGGNELEEDRWLAKKSLRDFAEMAWSSVEPERSFVPGWHIDAICDHLEAVHRREILRLIINVPPGYMKSLLVGVLWPAWMWANEPQKTFMFIAYGDTLARRDSRKMRRLVGSPWYERMFPEVRIREREGDTQTKFETTLGGFRLATSMDGMATGEHVDIQAGDDMMKATDAHYKNKREFTASTWDDTFASRMRKGGARVVIGQRLHESDLPGVLIKRGEYDLLCLPEAYEPTKRVTSIGFKDPRTKPGELLWPAMFDQKAHEQRKMEMRAYGTAGQLQQRPSPAGGGILKPEWFKFWSEKSLPPKFERMEVCVDANFKEGDDNDNVAIGVWGDIGPDSYLIDMVPPKAMSYVQTKRALMALADKYTNEDGECAIKSWRIEAAANGHALISELKTVLQGVVPFKPAEYGSKVARAEAASPQIESGNVYVPEPESARWVDEYLHEMESFPKGDHDDMVDMTTMHLLCRKRGFRTDFAIPDAEPDEAKAYDNELGATSARPAWSLG